MSNPTLEFELNNCQGNTPQVRAHISYAKLQAEADKISEFLQKAWDITWEAPDERKGGEETILPGTPGEHEVLLPAPVVEVRLDPYMQPIHTLTEWTAQQHQKFIDFTDQALGSLSHLPSALLPDDISPSEVLTLRKRLRRVKANNRTLEEKFHKDLNKVLSTAQKMPGMLRDVPNLPPLSTELGPPRQFDYGAAIKRACIGLLIELSTIPLYLYAMYSVKPTGDNNLRVRALLRGILQQEMLHTALVGNLISSLGGSVVMYDPRIIPMFPATLLCSKIPMHLEALNTGSLGRFMEIEAPVDAERSGTGDRNTLASQYDSIGSLYEDLVLSIRGLSDQQFTNNMDNQFLGQDFFGDQLFAITDQASALKALGTVIEQGEGDLSTEDSHYEIFSKLYSGPTWDVYNVPTDPKTVDYGDDDQYLYIHKVNSFLLLLFSQLLTYNCAQLSLSIDAAYCYLLQTIQLVYETNDVSNRLILLRNIHGLMSNVIMPLSELIVQQSYGDGCAAPCFNYYPMFGLVAGTPLVPIKLHGCLTDEIAGAIEAAPLTDDVARLATEAAGRAADGVLKAVDRAERAAGTSSDAIQAREIAGDVEKHVAELKSIAEQVEQDVVQLNLSPDPESMIRLTNEIGRNAIKIADHVQATARIGVQTSGKAAREAAQAALELREAGEAANKVALRAAERPMLERIKAYVEDNLHPPY
ncbi:hypothetical protein NP233_g5565 [Leucocoprinus birnbaumii]|uniref:Iminophenyl-pyruvate dimer synthase domain-containing protein n=1 Tax=Leucocoprinus birnbaumii TaxID=56174 RepID=A0AAD5VV95_9AGAR|nr:hypothetical protein NP233_g5565 [Leucocoprinus birnbaumii]